MIAPGGSVFVAERRTGPEIVVGRGPQINARTYRPGGGQAAGNRDAERYPAFAGHCRRWMPALLGASALAGLYAVSRYDFLLFHCLVKAFTIIVAIAVFAIFWNTRRFLDNGIYLVLGLGCLFAGLLDLIYVFAYPGMSAFFAADANLAMQAKTVGVVRRPLVRLRRPVHSPQDQPEGGVGDLRHHSGAVLAAISIGGSFRFASSRARDSPPSSDSAWRSAAARILRAGYSVPQSVRFRRLRLQAARGGAGRLSSAARRGPSPSK